MPDQSDNRPYPKSHEQLGLSRQPIELSPNRLSPDPISGDYQPHAMEASGASPRSYSGLRNALDLIPRIRDRDTSAAPRKRRDYITEGGHARNGGKRVATVKSNTAVPQNDTMIITKDHFQDLENEIKSLQRRSTEKNEKIASQERLIDSFHEVNQHVQFMNSSLENTVADLQKELDEREKHGWCPSRWLGLTLSPGQVENTALKSKVHELEKEIDAYRTTLANKDKEFVAARDEFTRELMEARALSTRVNFKISDDEIKGKWQELTFKVRQFVNCHYALSTNLSTETVQNWRAYCATPTIFLSNPLLTPLLFEANVWYGLEKIVFQPSSGSWAGEIGTAYNYTCSTVKGATGSDATALKEYHEWRSRSVDFISRLSPFDECRMKSLTTKMAKGLLWDRPRAGSEATCEITDIIVSAAELDLTMRKSKAEVKVHFQDLPLTPKREERRSFTKEWMEARNVFGIIGEQRSSGSQFVDLIISPVLTKRGDSKGDKYEVETVLVKADVVCGVLEALNDEADNDKPAGSRRSARLKTEQGAEEASLVESEPMDTPMVDAVPSLASATPGQIKSEGTQAKK